jgi:sugar lactone lactonase YvrE
MGNIYSIVVVMESFFPEKVVRLAPVCPSTNHSALWYGTLLIIVGLLTITPAHAQNASYTLGQTNLVEGPSAGADSVIVAVTPSTASWTAATNATWLHLTVAYQSGTGSANIVFSFDANSGATRSSTLTIGGQTLTITQAGSTYSLDNVLSTVVSSGLSQPHGLALDGQGNLYIADTANNAIKECTATNHLVRTLASTGLNNPLGVAVDAAGNVYIADTDNNAIKEWVAMTSNVITLVSSGLLTPTDVALDCEGNVYISDSGHAAIDEWTVANSNLVVLAQGEYVCSAPALAVDIAGNIYFNDTCNDTFKVWTGTNTDLSMPGTSTFYDPESVAVDGSGNAYIADGSGIYELCPSGGSFADALNPPLTGLGGPAGLAVDQQRNLFVAESTINVVEEFLPFLADWTPKVEGLAAGVDSLPAVLPAPTSAQSLPGPISNEPWLTISGVTNGIVYFAFTAATSTRTGLISWLGKNFPVTQRAPSQTIGTTSLLEGPGAGADSVILSVYPYSSTWTATANSSWLHLTPANQAGIGCTNVVFTFDANPGSTRSGSLTIVGQTVTVTQAGANYVAAQPAALIPVVNSELTSPGALAVDSSGDLFILDSGQVKVWSPATNTVTTLISSGLNNPSDLALDSAGNIYITDNGTTYNGSSGSNVIRKYSAATGSLSPLAILAPDATPGYIALDQSGTIYFNDASIEELDPASGNITTLLSDAEPGEGLAVDGAGNNFYFTIPYSLAQLNLPSDAVTTLATPSPYGFDEPSGLALDGSGNVYVSDAWFNDVLEWSLANNALTTLWYWPGGSPRGTAVDLAGNVYFSASENGTIMEIPHAFVDPTSRFEPLTAGTDSLLAVVPATQNLLPPLAPSSDQQWLTITGVSNGVVMFSFSTNFTSPTRTGHISLLGQSITIVQSGPVFSLGRSLALEGPGAGSASVVLSVVPNFGVWTATNNATWLHMSPGDQGGTGSTNVVFSFDANTGPTRSGTLTIGGQSLTVTQAGSNYVAAQPLITLVSPGLSGPSAVATDTNGNVFFADTGNNAIKEWVAASNSVATLVSSGLSQPRGLAVDSFDNLYIADTGDNAIKEWTPSNSTLNIVVSSGLIQPGSVAVDGAGNVYIADTFNNAIKKWMAAGSNVIILAQGLSGPSGVAVDVAENVYIADSSNNVIRKWVAASSNLTTLASGLNGPSGVAVDGAGNVYIANTASNTILKWTAASNTLTEIGSGFNSPSGVAVDGAGNVYLADTGNNVIKEMPYAFVNPSPKLESANAGNDTLIVLPATENLLAPFTPTSDQPWLTISDVTNGVVDFSFAANLGSSRIAHIALLGQTIPVTQGGLSYSLGTTALLEGPAAGSNSVVLAVAPKIAAWMATTNAAWLHLSQAMQSGTGSTNVVFSYDANPGATRSGTLTIAGQTLTVTQAGSTYVAAGPVTPLVSSGLAQAQGLAVDGAGNVYIADTGHNAIKRWTVANNTVTPLVSSNLSLPQSVAVDGAGNVYIADSGNNAIKEWMAANSNVTTLVSSGLSEPAGVAVDGAGNVYIADTYHNAIKQWTAAKNAVTTLVSSGLSDPSGAAVDGAGNVYIADTYHNAIKQWTAAKNTVATLVSSGLSRPFDVAVDGAGNVYIADTYDSAIKEWMAANSNVTTLVSSGLSRPYGVAVDGAGNVYIADSNHNAIKELPYAFVDPTPKLEPLAAGNDALPVVLPTTENLLPPFAPTSSQSWLTIGAITNGVVRFSFTANSGPARTANITLLGQSIPITQGVIGTPPTLTVAQELGNGVLQFSFTNNPSGIFTVLSATNLSLPLNNWRVVGSASNMGAGQFQFTVQPPFNAPQSFYTVRSP